MIIFTDTLILHFIVKSGLHGKMLTINFLTALPHIQKVEITDVNRDDPEVSAEFKKKKKVLHSECMYSVL